MAQNWSSNDNIMHTPPPLMQQTTDFVPPVGTTPPQQLAIDAANGQRAAAWRLLHWLMEDDPRAVEAIASCSDERLTSNLLEFLAIKTWAGKPFIVPTHLRTPHANTRLRTLFLPASGIDQRRVQKVLLQALSDKRPAIRATAIHLLGLRGQRDITPLLIAALKDPAESVRIQAIKALGQIGDSTAVSALLETLHTADENMANQIFQSIVALGPISVPALIAEASNDSPWLRWNCIRALGEIGDDRAIPVIVKALTDQDHAVAWIAAKELPNFGRISVGPLLQLLEYTEPYSWLRETAAYVLNEDIHLYKALQPYLIPVLKEMHSIGARISTPLAARRALEQLQHDGLVR